MSTSYEIKEFVILQDVTCYVITVWRTEACNLPRFSKKHCIFISCICCVFIYMLYIYLFCAKCALEVGICDHSL